MDYIILYRESNDFSDVLTDTVVKKAIRTKISFTNHLIIEVVDDKNMSYVMLKYGSDSISMTDIAPDRSPIPNKDYVPVRKDKKKKSVLST